MSFPILPTAPRNILLTPERDPTGVENYDNLWRNVLSTEINRLEQLVAQANGVVNSISSGVTTLDSDVGTLTTDVSALQTKVASYVHPYRGSVILGASATTFTITHNLGIPSPFTAIVVIWNSSGVAIANTIFTGSTFTTNAVAYTMLSTALPAGTYAVYVSGN
jgi:glutamate mutase epsilon subunit